MKNNIMLKLLIPLICVFIALSLGACRTVGGGVHVEGDTASGHPPVIQKVERPIRKIEKPIRKIEKPIKKVEKPIQKVEKKGPPLHASAHGLRAKHCYRYYPSSEVYFDVQRKVYFYLEGRNWRMSASLPRDLHLGLSGFVNIDMDTDKPYVQHKEHKKKYPPVKSKTVKSKKIEKSKKVKRNLAY